MKPHFSYDKYNTVNEHTMILINVPHWMHIINNVSLLYLSKCTTTKINEHIVTMQCEVIM